MKREFGRKGDKYLKVVIISLKGEKASISCIRWHQVLKEKAGRGLMTVLLTKRVTWSTFICIVEVNL